MENTWAFTRYDSLFFKYIELLFYIGMSNTENLTYFFMILSMYVNAGLISLVYPISIFGYALLEETRPRREYWTFVRVYTTIILLAKFVWNLSIWSALPKHQKAGTTTATKK